MNHRPDWSGKVDYGQYPLCVPLDRIERTSRGGRTYAPDDRDQGGAARYVFPSFLSLSHTALASVDVLMWISSITVVIVEGGVRLKLNIVDTPGYGDQVNNEGCWEPIVRYVRLTQYTSHIGM
jgi:hypothetical protein